MLQDSHPRSLRGAVRRHPEGGARCGVLRWRLVTAAPGGRDPARQALRPGCEELAVSDPLPAEAQAEGGSGERSAAPGAQNRHGGAPRGERPASWDARRLASAWRAALRARPRVFRRAPERLSALRPPLNGGVSEAKRQSPDAEMRARERDGLFDMVRFAMHARPRLPGRPREGHPATLASRGPRCGGPGPPAGVHGSGSPLACARVGRDDDRVARRTNLQL
jgi:hypothetical protein